MNLNLLPLPVMAVDSDIVGIIVLVLSALGIFVRAIKGKGDEPDPPLRRDRPEAIRTEIQDFLDEIAGSSPKKPPNRQAPNQRPPERTRPPVKSQGNKKSTGKPKQTVKPAAAAKPVKLSEQHLPTSNLGGGLRKHVASYMPSDRVGQEVQRDLKSRIAEEVEADLGRSSSAAPSPSASQTVHPLVKMLRDPQGVRTAIALQEILQKPRSLR